MFKHASTNASKIKSFVNKRYFCSNAFAEKPVQIGSFTLGVPVIIPSHYWNRIADKEVYPLFAELVEKNNVTMFDAGDGRPEPLINGLRQNYQKTHPNTKIAISTKFSPIMWFTGKQDLLTSLLEAIDRYDSKHADLITIDPITPAIEEWADALAEAYSQGKFTEIGISCNNPSQLVQIHKEFSNRGLKLAANRIGLSLMRTNPLYNGTADLCKELGIPIISVGPLSGGMLTGKYSHKDPSPVAKRFGKSLTDAKELLDVLKEIAKNRQKTVANVALNWVLCKGAVPLLPILSSVELEDTIACLGWRLTEEEVKALDVVAKHGMPIVFE